MAKLLQLWPAGPTRKTVYLRHTHMRCRKCIGSCVNAGSTKGAPGSNLGDEEGGGESNLEVSVSRHDVFAWMDGWLDRLLAMRKS